MAAKLFVGNLSFQATEEDLRELFAQAGNVETVRIITDQFTGRPRGFGFVEMATKEEGAAAIQPRRQPRLAQALTELGVDPQRGPVQVETFEAGRRNR